jgi:hypothetical protein
VLSHRHIPCCIFRKSGGSLTSGSVAQCLPDEIRHRDEQLCNSMERYRLQCEHLGDSLEECEEKLSSFEIQEEYHVADLRKELASVKKLLMEERKRSGVETQKLVDVQAAFGQVFKDYQSAVESLKQVQQDKRTKVETRDL